MFGLFSSKSKSTDSSNKSNETSVTFNRKRKRDSVQAGDLDGEVIFISEKKPKLERTASQSSLLSSFLSIKTIQTMSDWVQDKMKWNKMFSLKPKPSKPALTHGNGQGIHGHRGAVESQERQDRSGARAFVQPKSTYRNRDSLPQGILQAGMPQPQCSDQSSLPPRSEEWNTHTRSHGNSDLSGSYSQNQSTGSGLRKVPTGSHSSGLPPGETVNTVHGGSSSNVQPLNLLERGIVNGNDLDKTLTRPPLHDTGSQTPSEYGESVAGSSVQGSSLGGRSRLSAMYQQMFATKAKEKFTADQSVRLQDKVRYRQLLQQFTTLPLPNDTSGVEPKPETIRDPICPTALPRFYFKSNDSILGSASGKSFKVPEKQEISPRPRIKVHASQRKTTQKQPSQSSVAQPVVNGEGVESDSLMYINDISAIHEIRTSNLPGSSKKISTCIDLTEVDDDDVQIVSPHASKHNKHSKTDYRESKFLTEEWMKNLTSQYNSKARERARQIKEEEIRTKLFDESRKKEDEDLESRIRRQMHIYKKVPAVTEEIFIEEEEEEELPDLTDNMEAKISGWLRPQPGGQVLIEKFRLQITRNDIATLAGLNWLNDEVINFYMNLLMERGEKNGKAKVYAFNTFFYPKILSGGQPAVKRWTRKVDIFAHDYILIPVHLGMHWCLAVVSFKKKQVQYYDSMGGNNLQCLNVIKKYLCDEHMEKKKQEFNLQGWSTVVVKDIPQQMNGSDCGMFACKYAEYITREAPITFTQQHMPYFRRRMVYEIVTGQLLQ